MSGPTISIIMLMHNRETYVGQAIESVLNQSFSDFEFIIVDNASTDGSKRIASEYAENDNRIKIINCLSGEIGDGRNAGLNAANGEFFSFIDDDDYCKSNYLGFLYNLAKENDADIAICGSEYEINGELKPKYVFKERIVCDRIEAVSYFLLRKYFNSGNPTKLFRRSGRIAQLRYETGYRYDDIHTMYKYFASVDKTNPSAVVAYGEPLYISRRHADNNSEASLQHYKINAIWLKEYLEAYRERTEYISREIPKLAGLAKWSEWSFMISMIEKITKNDIDDCNTELASMKEQLRGNKTEFMNAKWTKNFERKWMEELL